MGYVCGTVCGLWERYVLVCGLYERCCMWVMFEVLYMWDVTEVLCVGYVRGAVCDYVRGAVCLRYCMWDM